MLETMTLKIEAEDAGSRLDSCVTTKLKGHSRSQIAKYIKLGNILVDGRLAKPSMTLMGTEEISFVVPDKRPSRLIAQNIPLDILYCDRSLAVINKPVGLVVHPGAGMSENTLCNALLHHFPDMAIGDEERPGIVHRLDKNTSGLMVVARTQEAHQYLSTEFRERRVTKLYRAWCWGVIDANMLEFKSGHVRHPKNALKFFTGLAAPQTYNPAVRLAHTKIDVINRFKNITEIVATLHTGRTHQIRAHMADNNYPLLGDHLYGGVRSLPHDFPTDLRQHIKALKGQALHAEHLAFRHPESEELMAFQAPLPPHLASLHTLLTS